MGFLISLSGINLARITFLDLLLTLVFASAGTLTSENYKYNIGNVNIPLNRVTLAGLLVALGIIYGDIGTSPLYVFNAIIKGRIINEALIIGSLSCIIWTITLQTTVK